MYAKFSLFQSPIDLAHSYWKELVKPGMTVIDATCGNGHDTLLLAQLALTKENGQVISIDIQEDAINSTKEKLIKHNIHLDRITFIQDSHEHFPNFIKKEAVGLIVYNLGYLPGKSKEIKTNYESTVNSIKNAMDLLIPGGAISITCYPGHAEGLVEESKLIEFSSQLDPQKWSCCYHKWLNRNKSPSLFFLQNSLPFA